MDGKLQAIVDPTVPTAVERKCSICGGKDVLLQCHACPLVLHSSCNAAKVKDAVFCTVCAKADAENQIYLSRDAIDIDSWVLVYVNHEWKKGKVISVDPARTNIVLIQWLTKTSSYDWVNTERVRIMRTKESNGTKRSSSSATGNLDERSPKRPRRGRPNTYNEDADAKASSRSQTELADKRSADNKTPANNAPLSTADGMTDTYISATSLKAALCAAGSACKAVDIVMNNMGSNVFVCARPPGTRFMISTLLIVLLTTISRIVAKGHHAGRNGCTKGSLSTGFCLLNNAAIALTYARIKWGLQRIAIVDIDVHFGNGTAEIVRGDPNTFFASVHMVYGPNNDGNFGPNCRKSCKCGFYPSSQGLTELSDNFVLVGVQPANVYAKECAPAAGRSRTSATSNRMSQGEASYNDSKGSSSSDSDLESVSDEGNASSGKMEGVVESHKPVQLFDNSLSGPSGYLTALRDVIIPKMEQFQPELLIISGKYPHAQPVYVLIVMLVATAGFDGYSTDPLGGEMELSLDDFFNYTRIVSARSISASFCLVDMQSNLFFYSIAIACGQHGSHRPRQRRSL